MICFKSLRCFSVPETKLCGCLNGTEECLEPWNIVEWKSYFPIYGGMEGGVILLFWYFFKFLLISFKCFQCFPVAETNYVLSEWYWDVPSWGGCFGILRYGKMQIPFLSIGRITFLFYLYFMTLWLLSGINLSHFRWSVWQLRLSKNASPISKFLISLSTFSYFSNSSVFLTDF